jgi:DNA-binding transcriptional LysR family regulator
MLPEPAVPDIQERNLVLKPLTQRGARHGLFCSFALDPRFVLRVDDNSIIQAAVAAGIGVALMPRLAVDPERADLRTIELPAACPRGKLLLPGERIARSRQQAPVR